MSEQAHTHRCQCLCGQEEIFHDCVCSSPVTAYICPPCQKKKAHEMAESRGLGR